MSFVAKLLILASAVTIAVACIAEGYAGYSALRSQLVSLRAAQEPGEQAGTSDHPHRVARPGPGATAQHGDAP